MSEERHVPSYEAGYLQALKDLRIYHQQVIDDGAGFEDAKGHRESIRFLDGLIAAKERRLGSSALGTSGYNPG